MKKQSLFEQRVRGICYKWSQIITGSVYQYDDLVQEALLTIWDTHKTKKFKSLNTQEEKESHLFLKVNSCLSDIARKCKRRQDLFDKFHETNGF